MHQNHHGFELCATALGSWDSDSAVPLHTRVLRPERRRQNAQLLAVKLGNEEEESRVCFFTLSVTQGHTGSAS